MKTKQFHFLPIEVASTLMFFWWALILLVSTNTFSTSHSYDVMANLMPEWAWGLLCLHNGILQLVGMHKIDEKKHKHKKIGLLIATGFWIFVATMILLGNTATTGTGTYFLFGCLNGWVYLNYYKNGGE